MIAAILTSTFLWVNLNSANYTQVRAIPNITHECAASLVDYRKIQGPYMSMSELWQFPCLNSKMRSHIRLLGITTARP